MDSADRVSCDDDVVDRVSGGKDIMEAEDLVEEYPDDFDGGAATSTTGKADGQRSGPADLPGM